MLRKIDICRYAKKRFLRYNWDYMLWKLKGFRKQVNVRFAHSYLGDVLL